MENTSTHYPELNTIRHLEAKLNALGVHTDIAVLMNRKVGDAIAATGDGSSLRMLCWRRWRGTPEYAFQLVERTGTSSVEHRADEWPDPPNEAYSRGRVAANGDVLIDWPEQAAWHGRALTARYQTITPWCDRATAEERATTLPLFRDLLWRIISERQRQNEATMLVINNALTQIDRTLIGDRFAALARRYRNLTLSAEALVDPPWYPTTFDPTVPRDAAADAAAETLQGAACAAFEACDAELQKQKAASAGLPATGQD